MARFWFFDGAFAPPSSAMSFEDLDDEWAEALSNVDVVPSKEGKLRSYAVCGGEYAPGSTDKHQNATNLLASHGLVLDVDVWHKDDRDPVEPFTADDLRARLEGYRFIAWTTWSSLPEQRKWRVVLPFDSPMPTKKYLSLWRKVNEALADTMSEASTADPARLGFFGSVQSEMGREAYEWFINPGDRLDWTTFDLEDSEEEGFMRALKPADLSRSPDWSTDDAAKEKARRYYRVVGRDVEVGSRHETLLRASCRLWWDWAAPNEQWVFDILNIIDSNFYEPKGEVEVWKEVSAGYDRTLGANRVEQPTSYGAEREPETRATKTGIAERGKHLLRQAREEDRVKGRALKAIALGESFAEPVEARKVALDVATELAQLYSRESPERLLDFMHVSLQAQRDRSQTHPIPTDTELLAKIRWKQKEIKTRADEREKLKNDQLRRLISKAFNGERDQAYTQKEYRDFEARGFVDDQWILQRDKAFYFFVNGEYVGPYSKEIAENFARVWLAPAHDRVKLTYVDKQGAVRDRPLNEIIKEYGTYLEKVEHCSYASACTYIEAEKKLIVPMKLRVQKAEYNHDVAIWLEALAGDKHQELLTWLAAVPSTDRELSALFLVTAKDQGKNLLTSGISRLWNESGAVQMKDYTHASYETSPVFQIDEGLPPAWTKKPTVALRQFLSEHRRDVKKPYTPPYSVSGFNRLVISANGLDIFSTGEDLSSNDIDAVGDRLLMIDTKDSQKAQKVLKSIGSRHRQFVTADLLAKHILHLRETIPLPPQRFVVSSAADLAKAMYGGNVDFTSLYDWLLTYFVNRNFFSDGVVTDADDPGEIYINVGLLMRAWPNLDKRNVSPTLLGRITKVVCSRGRRYCGQNRLWYRQVRPDLFDSWLQRTVDADVEDFEEALRLFLSKKAVKLGEVLGETSEEEEVEA